MSGPLQVTGGAFAPGTSPGVFSAGSTTLGPSVTFEIEIAGLAAGPQHDQLKVTGAVNLSGVALKVVSTFEPATGNTFKLVDNDGTTDAVNGTFAGLPEGATLIAGVRIFAISYGRDGSGVGAHRGALRCCAPSSSPPTERRPPSPISTATA